MKALIVDDDFTSRLLLQTFLSRYGECHTAVNGREAVEAFRTASDQGSRYDLICLDIVMPEMDGKEALKQVRALEVGRGVFPASAVTIIMTTAVNEVKEVAGAFEERCDSYLFKPVDTGRLLRQLKSFQLVE